MMTCNGMSVPWHSIIRVTSMLVDRVRLLRSLRG
jgi:hypothetical protein